MKVSLTRLETSMYGHQIMAEITARPNSRKFSRSPSAATLGICLPINSSAAR